MDLKEQESLGGAADAHWYYRAKSAAMRRMLRGLPIDAVLDVGAGSGFFARQLLEYTPCAAAICVDPNYPAEWSETHGGKPILFQRHAQNFSGHLVLMMDVLEHVADDGALLRSYAASVPRGTHFLITVPAMPWMWSGHDVFLEHYRRYTISSLDRALAAGGLQRLEICYFFGLVLPLAAGVRLGRRLMPWRQETPVSDMRRQYWLVNFLLERICLAELPCLTLNRFAGLSVFALAKVG